MRNYLVFQQINDISNKLEIDPAELFYQYDLSIDEIEDYYNWINN